VLSVDVGVRAAHPTADVLHLRWRGRFRSTARLAWGRLTTQQRQLAASDDLPNAPVREVWVRVLDALEPADHFVAMLRVAARVAYCPSCDAAVLIVARKPGGIHRTAGSPVLFDV